MALRHRRTRQRLVAQALVYSDGRVLWAALAQSEGDFAALYPLPNICGRHFGALAHELRSWREVST